MLFITVTLPELLREILIRKENRNGEYAFIPKENHHTILIPSHGYTGAPTNRQKR